MARIRMYKLYTTATATASNSASLTIPQSGVITAIHWQGTGTGGAAITSGISYELSTSSVSTWAQNDTPGNSISGFGYGSNVASSTMVANDSQSNLGVPVTAGDKLYLHTAAWATAPSVSVCNCWVAIMH